jgi:probable HAF family extracellular repeat protein/YD repeat-containing protein
MRFFHQFRPPNIALPHWCLLVASIFLYAEMLRAAPASTYTVAALSIPRQAFSGQASTINDAGVSAGWYQTSRGYSAVSWSAAGELTELGTLSGFANALANGINQSGTIVGFAFSSDFLVSRGFIWRSDTGMQPLADLGGDASLAQAVNADGTTVGWAYDPAGVLHAVQWSAAGTLTDLNPPGAISEALGINDAGDVVGWVFAAGADASHAHLWRHDGGEVDLGTLGGPGSQAFGVNNALAVVGVSDRTSPRPPVAFFWREATGLRSLNMGANSQAFAINDLGRSVGLRVINGGVLGLTRFHGSLEVLPDLAPDKPPASGPTWVNRCGTIVGSSSSPSPTNGNPVPAIWTKGSCD